jgi:hypothetical protein
MTLDYQRAHRFAETWYAAWTSHDLAAILDHYADDVEMASPLVSRLAGLTRSRVEWRRSRLGPSRWVLCPEWPHAARLAKPAAAPRPRRGRLSPPSPVVPGLGPVSLVV